MTDLEVQAASGTAVEDLSAAIELDGLKRNYGERAALDGVTLALGAGRTLVVFGPNGAGKTTLLRVLATLLRPHSGRVTVLGEQLPEDAWQVRGRVGLLGHEPLLYRELTPRENLRYHARLHGVGDERVEERLEAVSMTSRADEPVRTLSRGMVQRVAVARATLHDPELLLLDEPYANLDPAAIDLVEPLIGAASERTRVLTSHNPGPALAEADLALGLRGGRVALLADAASVDPDAIAELYR
jgi:heme exporter protein A